MTNAYLALGDGRVVEGRCRAPGVVAGELVFTTAATGYEESLTDPSYESQVLTFAYPLVGNYGVRPERFESDRVHPGAVVARELTDDVARWLREEGVPAVDRVDTRALVATIRDGGTFPCGVVAGPEASPADARAALDLGFASPTDLGASVSVAEPYRVSEGDGPTVALVDCGVKRSIVSSLTERRAAVHVFPYDATPEDVADVDPDLLFLSNGPGDPATYEAAKGLVRAFADSLPIAGICLGHQIVARALGGDTEKMLFGHRGVNQPVRDRYTDRVVVTTQNHGYAVSDPGDLVVTEVNVNDGTCEGLAHPTLPIRTCQYHPEAHPGPHDTFGFFDTVADMAGRSSSCNSVGERRAGTSAE